MYVSHIAVSGYSTEGDLKASNSIPATPRQYSFPLITPFTLDPYIIMLTVGGARGVMVIVAGYGHGDTSSNPESDWLHLIYNTLGKGMNPIILPPAMGK